MVFRGCAVLVTGGAIVYPHADQLDAFRILNAKVQPGGLTLATWLFIGVVIVTWFLLAFTSFGRCLYAVGGNPEAARLSGISVARVRVLALVISGVCASLAGLVLASRAGSAQASMGTGLELIAIAATVVGGTSIMGGEGATTGLTLRNRHRVPGPLHESDGRLVHGAEPLVLHTPGE